MAAPIGIADNEVISIDINEKFDGPHGLIAGMVGAGKSELINSYILSMAINFHPHDVSFIIVE